MCVVRGFNYMKSKILCFTFICFNTNNKARFLWITLLHSCSSICTRRNQLSQNDFPIQLRTCFGCASSSLPWFLCPTVLKAADKCWLFCSVFAQWFSTPDTDCPIRLTLGLVLRRTAKNISRECWAPRLRSCNVFAHSMGQINVLALILSQPLP